MIRNLKLPVPLPQLELERIARDPYHRLLSMSWKRFILYSAVVYVFVNTFFAWLFYLQPGCIANSDGSFADSFIFSVQTISTIGYGYMYPITHYANFIVFVEVFVGVVNLALATGILFAKVSLPHSQILFSKKALLTEYDGEKSLLFRVANKRNNQIIDAKVYLTLMKTEVTKEGIQMRRFYDLPTLRRHSPLLSFSWTVVHRIDESSPLFRNSLEEMLSQDYEIIVTLMGIDGTFASTMYDKYFYRPQDIHFGGQFEDVLSMDKNGITRVEYEKFHNIVEASGLRNLDG